MNRFTCFLFLACLSLAAAQFVGVRDETQPISLWTFQEGQGLTSSDLKGVSDVTMAVTGAFTTPVTAACIDTGYMGWIPEHQGIKIVGADPAVHSGRACFLRSIKEMTTYMDSFSGHGCDVTLNETPVQLGLSLEMWVKPDDVLRFGASLGGTTDKYVGTVLIGSMREDIEHSQGAAACQPHTDTACFYVYDHGFDNIQICDDFGSISHFGLLQAPSGAAGDLKPGLRFMVNSQRINVDKLTLDGWHIVDGYTAADPLTCMHEYSTSGDLSVKYANNNLYHIVGTQDCHTRKIYLNGEEVYSFDMWDSTVIEYDTMVYDAGYSLLWSKLSDKGASRRITLGHSYGGNTADNTWAQFKGEILMAAMYNTSLSADAVMRNYHAGQPSTAPQLEPQDKTYTFNSTCTDMHDLGLTITDYDLLHTAAASAETLYLTVSGTYNGSVYLAVPNNLANKVYVHKDTKTVVTTGQHVYYAAAHVGTFVVQAYVEDKAGMTSGTATYTVEVLSYECAPADDGKKEEKEKEDPPAPSDSKLLYYAAGGVGGVLVLGFAFFLCTRGDAKKPKIRKTSVSPYAIEMTKTSQ